MQLDDQITRLRQETPACDRLMHFNNAGFSLTPRRVVDGVIHHLYEEQRIGGYEAAAQAVERIENFYNAFANLLNCQTAEIAYIENATRAWDLVFYSIPLNKGDIVLTGQSEYASNYLAMLQLQKRRGIEIVVIPNNHKGTIDTQLLQERLSPQVKLIALTHVPSQIGAVQPAAEVGVIAKRHSILYLLDVCQSAGQLPLDVEKLHCDFLSGTGRKYLRGPRGTGFLYVRQSRLDQLDPVFVDLHSARWLSPTQFEFRPDARRFENWESFVAGKIGLGIAVDYALQIGIENIAARLQELADKLVQGLRELPGIEVFESGPVHCGIITFVKADESPNDLQTRMQRAGINIGVSKRASAVIDFTARGLDTINRASLHYYNTAKEIDRFIDVLSA